MKTEVMVALIGGVTTVIAALLGYLGTRPARTDQGRSAAAPIAIGVVTFLILAGLGGWAYSATRNTSGSTADPGGSPTGGPPTNSPPPGQVTFPSTPEEYSEQLVIAWGKSDTTRLSQLATAKARTQLGAIAGSPKPDWDRQKCVPVEESNAQYCTYFNSDGDVLGVTVQSGALGRAQAVDGTTFNRTTYPTDARKYVEAFLDAWRAGNVPRLRRLAVDKVVGQIGEMRPPTGTSISTDAGAGHAYITVNSASGSLTFDLLNQTVAQARPQAIVSLQIG